MEKANKKTKQLQNKLFSLDTELVLKTIEDLRKSGNIADVSILIDLLVFSNNETVKEAIASLLNDVKDVKIISVLVQALSNEKYKSENTKLLAACWQSGLDYSVHIALFVDLMLGEKLETAIEAFTVIENQENMPQQDVAGKQIEKIKSELATANPSKQVFLLEAIHYFEKSA